MPVWLFTRTRGGVRPLMWLALAVFVAAGVVPIDHLGVPLREDAVASLYPSAALLAGVAVVMPLGAPWRDLEESVPKSPLRWLRAGWCGALMSTAGITAVAVLVGRGMGAEPAWLFLRSLALGLGISGLSTCMMPRTAAWIPAVLFAMASWVWGTTDLSGTATWWAIPNHAPDSVVATALSLFLLLASWAVYSWFDGRQVP